MINRIKDWKLQIAQALLPLLVIPAVILLDLPQRFFDLLKQSNVQVSSLEWYWQLLLHLGNWAIIILALFFIYRAIRKHNEKEVIKQNIPNTIVWHSYPGYWFCRHFLNYQTVSLTRVPIPVQFELVWNELFKKYECMEGVTEITDADTISVEILQAEPYTSTVNLILADTYPLDDWKAKVPAPTSFYSTVIVNRSGERVVRYYSKEFISKIATTVHELPATVTDINIFATINAAHVYHIVNEVFKTGGRDGIKRIRIYQQTSGTWVFEGKKYKEIQIGVQ